MKNKSPHSHGWLVGVFGLAAGIALMVVFPKLKAIAGVVMLVALLHLVGAALVVGSLYSFAPERFNRLLARLRKRAPDDRTYDFGWSWGAMNGPWLAAAAFVTVAFGLQLEFPSLWPAWSRTIASTSRWRTSSASCSRARRDGASWSARSACRSGTKAPSTACGSRSSSGRASSGSCTSHFRVPRGRGNQRKRRHIHKDPAPGAGLPTEAEAMIARAGRSSHHIPPR